MNRFLVLTLMVIVPVAGVLMTTRSSQPGLESDPQSALTILEAVAVIHQEARKREDLDATFQKITERIALKREVADRVIAGSMTLEAAALFREVIAECSYADLVLKSNEGSSELERIYRDVIGWVSGELAHDPARQKAEVARLEAEIASRLPS